MGAAAGHIKHLHEDLTLTFNEIITIFDKLEQANIQAYEKIDGQNLMITFKNSSICAARNKSQLINPIPIMDILPMFDSYINVKETFKAAIKTIQSVFAKIGNENLQNLFCNGTKYLNIEIVNANSQNIISYGDPKIIFNSICVINNEGNIQAHNVAEANAFYNTYANIFAINQIYPPLKCKLVISNNNKNNAEALKTIFKSLGITNLNMTVGQYYELKKLKVTTKSIPNSQLELVLANISNKLIMNTKSIIADNKDTVKSITNGFKKMGQYMMMDPELTDKLKWHVDKFNVCGGMSRLPNMEGIVFYYNGIPYKLTGIFAPINQILGRLKYSLK